ncbi:MAG: hypothetical protein IJ583_16995 [Firmicutes bacterium]|nr:hypothetical protein [Bacillota bacterium]
MKQKYISPECEIIRFESEDVLTASGVDALGYDDEQEGFADFSGTNFR